MHKLFTVLILLSMPVSNGALAHSGTDQEEKACAPDVQRFCRKLMDQGDFTILACLKENRPKLTPACRYVLVSHGAIERRASRLFPELASIDRSGHPMRHVARAEKLHRLTLHA